MREIKWGRILSVDVDEIDEDHKKLINIFNLLNQSLQDGDDKDYVEAVIEELINCTVWHFSHEDRLMLKYNYPEHQEHKQEHKELIESARELQDKIQNSENPVSETDVDYLESWLTEHILTFDMRLGAYLCQTM